MSGDPKIVQLPSGESAEFPSEMSDAEIAAAINKHVASTQAGQVEQIRQRNMQNALQKSQSPMSNFLAPFRPAAEEWNKNIYGGQNPLAAAAAGVNMAVKGLGGLMQMPVKISELNPSPETVGAHMINYGMGKVAQGIGSGIEAGLGAIGEPEEKRTQQIQSAFNLNPQQAQSVNEAGTNLLNLGAQVGLGEGVEAAAPLIGKGLGALVPKELPTRLEAYASKPAFVVGKGIEQFDRQIGTVLKENLAPTRGGLQKVGGLLTDLDNVSKPLREEAVKSGKTINFNDFNDFLEKSKDQYKNDANAAEKSVAIDDMKSRVDALAKQYPNGEVPFDAAWRFKQTLQDMVGGKYDEVAGYGREAAKTAAHGLLDDMISKVPDLRDIGLRQRDLIEAQGMIAKRVAQTEKAPLMARAGRAGLFGIGVGAFTHDPLAALGVGAAEYISESPQTIHTAAVALDRLKNLGKTAESPYGEYTPTPFKESPDQVPAEEQSLHGIDISKIKGTTDAHNAGLSIANDPQKIRSLYAEYVENQKAVNEGVDKIKSISDRTTRYKAQATHEKELRFPNQMRQEILSSAFGSSMLKSMTPEQLKLKIQNLKSPEPFLGGANVSGAAGVLGTAASVPAVAQKAYDKAKAGKKTTMRERNLIRQNFPNEADQILSR